MSSIEWRHPAIMKGWTEDYTPGGILLSRGSSAQRRSASVQLARFALAGIIYSAMARE
jgi:hypothetical protein